MRYSQLQAYMAWYSTLGGAHSSLGDRFGVHVSIVRTVHELHELVKYSNTQSTLDNTEILFVNS